MEQGQAEKILEMGIQLTSERNYDELLAKIIDCAMETTNCDGGTPSRLTQMEKPQSLILPCL